MNISKIIHGKKTNIEIVRAAAKEKGGVLLSTEYLNMNSPLKWRCKCSNIFITSFNKVRHRKQWCPECGRKKGIINMRNTFANDPSVKIRISCGHRGIDETKFNGFISIKNRKIAKLRRHNKRYKEDVNYMIKIVLRNRLYHAIKNNHKAGSAVKDLGCSIEELKKYLESKFQPGMTWSNYGKWHIDHIKPLSKFNLENKEELKEACNYKNLQPLWAIDNLIKGAKYDN